MELDAEELGAEHSSIEIYLRVRPVARPVSNLLIHEEDCRVDFTIPKPLSSGFVNNLREQHNFKFHGIFSPDATQDKVFDTVAERVVLGALEGFNGTIFAFGQTGSGKTFTMTGGPERYADRGLIPRAISEAFNAAAERVNETILIRISYMEIYNEVGYDLLDPSRNVRSLEDLPRVHALEDEDGNVHLRNLRLHRVESEEDALNLLFLGDTNRAISTTPMNLASSRSHCVFTLHVETRRVGDEMVRRSKLNLVDLAGSERVARSNLDGSVLREAKYINLSLHYLEQVIIALQERSQGGFRVHVPYRNSMMTTVLRDSLGGNTRTVMIATITGALQQLDESISTCRFAQRVALVTNKVTLNEEADPLLVVQRLQLEIRGLKEEIRRLKGEAATEGPLSPEELAYVKTAVAGYIADQAPDATLTLAGGMRANAAAFATLREMICGGDTAANAEGSAQAPDQHQSTYIDSLKAQVRQRDSEISVLMALLERQKALSFSWGSSPPATPAPSRAMPRISQAISQASVQGALQGTHPTAALSQAMQGETAAAEALRGKQLQGREQPGVTSDHDSIRIQGASGQGSEGDNRIGQTDGATLPPIWAGTGARCSDHGLAQKGRSLEQAKLAAPSADGSAGQSSIGKVVIPPQSTTSKLLHLANPSAGGSTGRDFIRQELNPSQSMTSKPTSMAAEARGSTTQEGKVVCKPTGTVLEQTASTADGGVSRSQAISQLPGRIHTQPATTAPGGIDGNSARAFEAFRQQYGQARELQSWRSELGELCQVAQTLGNAAREGKRRVAGLRVQHERRTIKRAMSGPPGLPEDAESNAEAAALAELQQEKADYRAAIAQLRTLKPNIERLHLALKRGHEQMLTDFAAWNVAPTQPLLPEEEEIRDLTDPDAASGITTEPQITLLHDASAAPERHSIIAQPAAASQWGPSRGLSAALPPGSGSSLGSSGGQVVGLPDDVRASKEEWEKPGHPGAESAGLNRGLPGEAHPAKSNLDSELKGDLGTSEHEIVMQRMEKGTTEALSQQERPQLSAELEMPSGHMHEAIAMETGRNFTLYSKSACSSYGGSLEQGGGLKTDVEVRMAGNGHAESCEEEGSIQVPGSDSGIKRHNIPPEALTGCKITDSEVDRFYRARAMLLQVQKG